MHAHGLASIEILKDLHCIGGVNVHALHEIARQIRSDEQPKKVDGAQALPDHFEVCDIACIAWEQKPS